MFGEFLQSLSLLQDDDVILSASEESPRAVLFGEFLQSLSLLQDDDVILSASEESP